MGYHALLQGIFLTQGLNLDLPHCKKPSRWSQYTLQSEKHWWRSLKVREQYYRVRELNSVVLLKCRLCFYRNKKLYNEVAQSCPTLCDPMDCSLPGSSVHGIFQARVLEWVAISFSRGSSQPRDQTWVSRIAGRSFTIWATREAPLYVYKSCIKVVILYAKEIS